MQNVEGRPQLRSATTGPIQLSDVQPQTVQQSFACVLWVHRMGHRTDDTERENSLSVEVERKLKMQARFRTASLSDWHHHCAAVVFRRDITGTVYSVYVFDFSLLTYVQDAVSIDKYFLPNFLIYCPLHEVGT